MLKDYLYYLPGNLYNFSMENTIFDKIIAGEIPCDKVYEDDDVLAFNDINPKAPVHILVIPKKKLATFNDVKEAEAEMVGTFFQKAALVAEKAGLEKDGYRVVVNCNQNGGQEVYYLHAHILGGKRLSWPLL